MIATGFSSAFLASMIPYTPCSGLQYGCGAGAANLLQGAIPRAASLMLQFAGGAAVLFIIWAGMQMLLSLGDESKVTQGKWGILYALAGLTIAILSSFIISVIGTQTYIVAGSNPGGAPFELLSAAIGILRTVLNAILLLVIVMVGIRMLYAQGKSDEFNKGKTQMTWALVGAVVVNLAAALVQIITRFFGV